MNGQWNKRHGLAGFLASLGVGLVATALGAASAPAAPAAAGFVRLSGHVHRLAQSRFDVGEAPDSLRVHGLDLVFAKSPAQQRALDQLLADQQNPKSPGYHHWLTPSEYGSRFGATPAAIATLSQWLEAQGFKVGALPAARGHLPFFGSKAQVEAAFHTQIHLFDVNGEHHYANVSDPMIPAEFQPLLMAIRGLNDFNPRAGVKSARPAARAPIPATYYSGSDQYPGYVGPSDFATIYDFAPAYQAGLTGHGVSVAIAAQSDIQASVLTTFWTAFGVQGSKFGVSAQQFTLLHVPAADGGSAPGATANGDEDEAYLDTEVIGGLAPGANLILISDMSATTAAFYAIDQNLAAVLNISFGDCESTEGSFNSTINSMFEQAVSQGMTITVSSADSGVAACTAAADSGTQGDVNSNGFAVNGIASTPYDLAVGGTDFNPNTETQYWSTTNQSGTLESALSHIPEMVWNDSCANPVIAELYGNGDPIAFCNTSYLGSGTSTPNPFIEISGAGGGLSSCITTDNSTGACTGGYAQPSWQANVLGISNFGTRAIPDVSMIATNWLICSYDTSPCDPTQAPTFSTTNPGTIKVIDGTSAAAPAVAAIIALIDQSQISATLADGRQGLINPTFYKLAGVEYGSSTALTACNASNGAIADSACIFYDVTTGSNAQPCKVSGYTANAAGTSPSSTCVTESGEAHGIMETGGVQAYVAGRGFDLATGLGSIDAGNLLSTYLLAGPAPTGLAASASGQTASLSWTADSNATGGFNIYEGTASGQESLAPVQTAVMATSATVSGLTNGQTYFFEIAAVSAKGRSPFSNEAQVTIVPAAPTGVMAAASAAGSLTLSWTASSGAANTYNIYEGTSSSSIGTTAVQSGISTTSSTLSGLTAGQQYFFTVAAVDAGGTSASSSAASGTVLAAVPAGLAATAGNGSVSLTWSSATGAASYNVYQGTTAGGEGATAVQTGLTGPSATVSGLSNGTKYYFKVAAVDAGGTSALSGEASATPTSPASGGGGGAMGWAGLALLAGLRVMSSLRAARQERPRA